MPQQPSHIKPEFAPEMSFELPTKTDEHPVQIAELTILPSEDQQIHTKIRLSQISGIPFSAIND